MKREEEREWGDLRQVDIKRMQKCLLNNKRCRIQINPEDVSRTLFFFIFACYGFFGISF